MLFLSPALVCAQEFDGLGGELGAIRSGAERIRGKKPAAGQAARGGDAVQGKEVAPPPKEPVRGERPPLEFHTGVRDYLAQKPKEYKVWPNSYYKSPGDVDKKLFEDTLIAIEAYEFLQGKTARFKDDQDFVSADFWRNTGAARFNPDAAQTRALTSELKNRFAAGTKLLQADLIYLAIVAADGNVTQGMGSLAEYFCWNRPDIDNVPDMSRSVEDKNYYRYAGFFIGLHGGSVRAAGEAGSWANMVGNPIVYAGAEIYASWKSFFSGDGLKPVDSLKTLGPEGNGNIVDKSQQLNMGLRAAEMMRARRNVKD